MKKVILTVVATVLGVVAFAQNSQSFAHNGVAAPQLSKYITTAPDGSVAMMVSDQINGDKLKLESAENFYRFEILDPVTNEAIYAAKNKGKSCVIDKSKLAEGAYNLRLYTANFVITSRIAISASQKMLIPAMPVGDIIASNDYDNE